MTEHRPECRWPEYAKRLRWGNVSRANRERVSCICKELLACEERVRHDERICNFTPDDHANGICEAFRLGLAAAREAVESQWTEDPSWDGTNWNNALHAAIAAIDTPQDVK